MSAARHRLPHAGGFTLIELMVTVAIIAVLATLTAPSFRALAANQTLSNTTQELMTALLTARSLALKNNQSATVARTDGTSWASGWQVFVDANSDGSYQSGTDTLVITREALDSDIAVEATSGGIPAALEFRYRADGFLAGGANKSVMLKSTYTGKKKCIIVGNTGRARITSPADTATSCTDT